MTKKRYLQDWIVNDLKDKMVFVSGPRQVGKTTLSQWIGETEYKPSEYLNWDDPEQRRRILDYRFQANRKLIIFDELHKYPLWRQYLKGLYDTHKARFKIIVTGSARLDIYRRAGESLLGRYHAYRLHPFSLVEVMMADFHSKNGSPIVSPQPFHELRFPSLKSAEAEKVFQNLLRFGGFPEIYIKQDERSLNRWHAERIDRVIRDDIRDLETVRDIASLFVLARILPTKVGSLFSLNSLREDLSVSHKTISHWVMIFEQLYYHFRLYPYASTLIQSLRKEPKLYLWDWSEVEGEAARFENMVASHLLKFVHFLRDVFGYQAELSYIRDREGREVDFLITVKQKPWFAVEVKQTDTAAAKNLLFFKEKLRIPFLYQIVMPGGINTFVGPVHIMSADMFLAGLV